MGTMSIMESVLRGCEELDLGSPSQLGDSTPFQACVWGLAVPTAWILGCYFLNRLPPQ